MDVGISSLTGIVDSLHEYSFCPRGSRDICFPCLKGMRSVNRCGYIGSCWEYNSQLFRHPTHISTTEHKNRLKPSPCAISPVGNGYDAISGQENFVVGGGGG